MSGGVFTHHLLTAPHHLRVALLSALAFTVSLSSAIAWKISDVDFATKIGSERLSEAYIFIAIVLFGVSSIIMSRLKWLTPQSIFLSVQRYASVAFGILGVAEIFFSLSSHTAAIFGLKVIGYAYSVLVLNSFWIALDPFNAKSSISTGECTLYSLSTYFGMAVAGVALQSETVGSGQLGLMVTCCSSICWFIGCIAFRSHPQHLERPVENDALIPRPSPLQTLFRSMRASRAVLSLVVGSVVLNVLVSSTEYYFISDFESRYISVTDAPRGLQSIGSFVTLIGFGNILALCTARLWTRFSLGRTGLPIATILAVLMIQVGFTHSHSLISSVLTLLVVESLYPLVVESNLQYLLARFPESEKVSARTMIDTIAEPAGLLLSAILLSTPWFDLHALGIGVVCVAFLLLLYSWSVDDVWRKSQVASIRQVVTLVSARASAFVLVCHTLLPCTDLSYDFADDLIVVEDYNWLHIPAVQWCD